MRAALSHLVISSALVACVAGVAAQSAGPHVSSDKVHAALAKGGTLIDAPQVRVAGGHHAKAGTLETQTGTSVLYVTDGEGTFVAGSHTQRLAKGDLVIIPAGTPQSFTSVSRSISFFMVIVPVLKPDAKAEFIYVPREQVEPAFRKAGTLADGPNLRVSGGYRTGPHAPADYRPAVEIHTNEADLFFIIEGNATQVLGGKVLDGKETGPGQIRGSKIDGGTVYKVARGDVMWVAAGVPHWFPEIPEPLGYLLVKVVY